MDKTIIRDLRVNGIIGIYDHERITPQEILINIVLYADTRKAAKSDDISDCVDYEKVSLKIKAHAETAHHFTVESLCQALADLCLETPGVEKVKVRVEKPQAISFTRSVGVEIKRRK